MGVCVSSIVGMRRLTCQRIRRCVAPARGVPSLCRAPRGRSPTHRLTVGTLGFPFTLGARSRDGLLSPAGGEGQVRPQFLAHAWSRDGVSLTPWGVCGAFERFGASGSRWEWDGRDGAEADGASPP